MSGTITPFVSPTPDDHGASVIVFAATACCFSFVFIIARLAVISYRKLDLQRDDFLIFASLVCPSACTTSSKLAHVSLQAVATAQTVLLSKAQEAGLGRHLSSLSADQITHYFKV
jgi:hypothetical protein